MTSRVRSFRIPFMAARKPVSCARAHFRSAPALVSILPVGAVSDADWGCANSAQFESEIGGLDDVDWQLEASEKQLAGILPPTRRSLAMGFLGRADPSFLGGRQFDMQGGHGCRPDPHD